MKQNYLNRYNDEKTKNIGVILSNDIHAPFYLASSCAVRSQAFINQIPRICAQIFYLLAMDVSDIYVIVEKDPENIQMTYYYTLLTAGFYFPEEVQGKIHIITQETTALYNKGEGDLRTFMDAMETIDEEWKSVYTTPINGIFILRENVIPIGQTMIVDYVMKELLEDMQDFGAVTGVVYTPAPDESPECNGIELVSYSMYELFKGKYRQNVIRVPKHLNSIASIIDDNVHMTKVSSCVDTTTLKYPALFMNMNYGKRYTSNLIKHLNESKTREEMDFVETYVFYLQNELYMEEAKARKWVDVLKDFDVSDFVQSFTQEGAVKKEV